MSNIKSFVLVAVLAVGGLTGGAATDAYGQWPAARFQLGVTGIQTDDGFLIQSVVGGTAATRLGARGDITLETGDVVTHVNGIALDQRWSLADAIAASRTGVVNLRIIDVRSGAALHHRGVVLDRK